MEVCVYVRGWALPQYMAISPDTAVLRCWLRGRDVSEPACVPRKCLTTLAAMHAVSQMVLAWKTSLCFHRRTRRVMHLVISGKASDESHSTCDAHICEFQNALAINDCKMPGGVQHTTILHDCATVSCITSSSCSPSQDLHSRDS